jgi:hypothetical protein
MKLDKRFWKNYGFYIADLFVGMLVIIYFWYLIKMNDLRGAIILLALMGGRKIFFVN